MLEKLDPDFTDPDETQVSLGVRYSDETTTGASRTELRGPRKVTIAARLPADDNNFEWVKRLRADFSDFLGKGEIKSDQVIQLCQTHPRARELVVRNIREGDVFVIDLFEDYHRVLDAIREMAPDPKRPIESFSSAQSLDRAELIKFLSSERRLAVLRSIVPMIEDLRSEASIFQCNTSNDPLIDLARINDLGEQELKELVVRFTVLFSDAIHPATRARAIQSVITSRCVMDRSHFAVRVLQTSTSHDMVFDKGSEEVMTRLVEADSRLQAQLETLSTRGLGLPKRSVRQVDSAVVHGVQSCDIAAGYARWRFESLFDGNTSSTAQKIRDEFSRVLYNTKWL